jgi:MFS family permease
MASRPDSPYAAFRLAVALVIMTIGASAMYVVPVVLPAVQAEFGVARADASLPYVLLMVGMGVGGVLMGRLADRHGVMVPLRHRLDAAATKRWATVAGYGVTARSSCTSKPARCQPRPW